MRNRRPSGSARASPSGSSCPTSARCESSTPTLGGKRRSAKASVCADAESSHWTSSTASSTAPFAAHAASTPTDSRKHRSDLIERLDDEVRESNVRQLLLALSRLRVESPDTPFLGAPEALEPERGFSDARLAFDDDRAWPR